jgi:hypothetical protein
MSEQEKPTLWSRIREFLYPPRPDKTAVGYLDFAAGVDDCGRCAHYLSTTHRCKLIRGRVSPNGWCRYFVNPGENQPF